jgi:hypothetical protein
VRIDRLTGWLRNGHRRAASDVPQGAERGSRLTRWASWAGIVAAVAAVVGIGLTIRADVSSGTPHAPRHAPQIESVDVEVPNPGRSERSEVQVILHNVGNERTIAKRVIVHILHAAHVTLCFSQGTLGLSERYNVQLPYFPTPGQIVEVPIHEQLAAEEADRFALSFGFEPGGVAGRPSIYLYQLELTVLHDLSPVPVRLGKVLLALPSSPESDEFFWTKELGTASARRRSTSVWGAGYYAKLMPCWRSNSLVLKQFLALAGERSPALSAVASRLVVPSAQMVRRENVDCREALARRRGRRGRAGRGKGSNGREFERAFENRC